ncbi:MAG: heavy-metal-associated domain-containing protein [Bacillota bacterium]
MSMYNERLNKLREEREKNYRSPFAKHHLYTNDRTVLITIIITNMYSDEDFNKIKTELLKVNGVIDVNRRLIKKVEIIYDNTKIGLQHIAFALNKTGYNYVKRY